LCHSLNHPRLRSLAWGGQYRYTLMTGKLSAAMQIAKRMYSLAEEQNDAALMLGAYGALTTTHLFLGEFEAARQYAKHGVQIWRSGNVRTDAEDYLSPVGSCLIYWAVCEWHFGDIASCHALRDEGISIAKELKDMNSLALALSWAAGMAANERNPAEVDRFASNLIELSTRDNFVFWLAIGTAWRAALLVTPRKVFR
jgi:hypothetical protein